MASSRFGYPLRIAQRTVRELSHRRLLYSRPRSENILRLRNWNNRATGDHKTILVVQLADIGDLVITSVFLRELRVCYPDAKIVLAVAPFTASYARLCPHVDSVALFDPKKLAGLKWKQCLTGCDAWWSGAADFKKEYFPQHPPDLGFTVRTHRDSIQAASQILLTATHVGQRVGYPLKPLFGYLRSTYLLDHIYPPTLTGHEIERQLKLLEVARKNIRPAGTLELWTSSQTERHALEIWKGIGSNSSGPFIGVGIGAGRPEKCWPLAHYAELVRWLESTGWTPLLIGSQADRLSAEKILSVSGSQRAINLTGQIPLETTAAFFKTLNFFVGNDSGPMHLAVAARVPTVGIFGPEDSSRWGPWPPGLRSIAVSAPEKNLPSLKPETVQAAILKLRESL